MAAAQENHEVPASEPVKAHAENVKLVSTEPSSEQPITTEQVNSASLDHLDAEPLDTQADTETLTEDLIGSEGLETHPVSQEPVEAIQGRTDPVNQEEFASEPADAASSDHPDTEPVTRQDDMEAAQMDSSKAEPADQQPPISEPVASEPNNTEPVNPQPIISRIAESETACIEPVDSQTVEPRAQAQVDTEPMSVDIADPQPIGQDLIYTHSDGSEMISSELVHSHPISSEHVNQEFVHSQSLDDGAHHGMYDMEMLHHQENELVKMERGHQVPVGSELEHQLQVSSELELHLSSDLAHQMQLSTELVHMQPIDSDLVHSQPISSDLIHSQHMGQDMSNLQIVSAEMVNPEVADPESQPPNKRRKKKSIVWEHFTIETVEPGCRRACCKVCKQSFAYSTGSKVAGTSHLKRHIAKGSCPMILRQQEKNNQLTPYTPKTGGGTESNTADPPPKRRYRTSASPYLYFDQDHSRREISKMIIMHDYPLHMVEHPGFVAFVQNLQPRFDMVNFNTVQGDCVATYLREKQTLQKSIDGIPGRLCLMLDMWGSSQTTGYVFLHGHFIDQDWKLHRRLLNVVMEPFPESDGALSHAVATCLSYWNLENKLCSITFNQQLSESALANMRGLLCLKSPSLLNGQLLVGSCLSRTLSDMAQNVFAYGHETVSKIRASVKYVKTTEALEDRFLELKQQLQVPSDKTLSLDNTTRWDTTYHMLKVASEMQQVFSCLDTSDQECRDAPTEADWKRVDDLCFFLKHFYETANFLLLKTPPPSNIFFHEVWKIQLELARAVASEDEFVSNLAKALQERFLTYWRNTCVILAISVSLDPRFKMKLVEFSFSKLFGEDAPSYIQLVDVGIHELFQEYGALPLPLTPTYTDAGNSGGGRDVRMESNQESGSLISSNGLTDFDMYIMETTSQQMKSELDQYLEESLLPRIQDFDVLGWWKLNRLKYPTLSKMARDLLSIPLTSVGPDSVFDTIGRKMDKYRCSLRPETLEALVCAKDWLQYAPVSPNEGLSGHVKMEL